MFLTVSTSGSLDTPTPGHHASLMDTRGPTRAAINALTHLGAVADKVRTLEAAKHHHVAVARFEGASWRMIGVALGISAQAAWERYNGPERDVKAQLPDQLPLPTDGT